MLVLTRAEGESIVIAGGIELTVVRIGNDRVRLGITAPRNTLILRKELVDVPAEEAEEVELKCTNKK